MALTAIFESNRDPKVHFSEYLITSFDDTAENLSELDT